jgi:hypothetical protein
MIMNLNVYQLAVYLNSKPKGGESYTDENICILANELMFIISPYNKIFVKTEEAKKYHEIFLNIYKEIRKLNIARDESYGFFVTKLWYNWHPVPTKDLAKILKKVLKNTKVNWPIIWPELVPNKRRWRNKFKARQLDKYCDD